MTQLEDIKKVLKEVLDERASIDKDTHRHHHVYIAECIEDSRNRKQRWEKIRANVYGWAIVTGVVSIGGVVWYAFRHLIGIDTK